MRVGVAVAVASLLALACQHTDSAQPSAREAPSVPEGPSVAPAPRTPAPELVANGGMEEPDPTAPDRPAGWSRIGWGDNDRVYGITPSGAHGGSRAARAEIRRWTSGAASWAFAPVPVQPLTRYQLSTWYRSSGPVELLAVERDAVGRQTYPYRRVLPAAPDWTREIASFPTSAGAATVTVYQSITSQGWVEIDDVSMREDTSAELQRPIVSLTFDDGALSHHEVALPALRAAGLAGTFYLTSEYLDAKGRPPFMTTRMAEDLRDAGMEIGGHTATHPHLSQVDADQLEVELVDSKRELERRLHVRVEDFASPFGDTNRTVRRRIMANYASHRTTSDGTNRRDDMDLSQLHAWLIEPTTTVAKVLEWLDAAREEKSWLIIVFHDIERHPSEYGTTPQRFQQIIDAVAESGLAVLTVSAARAEIVPQLPR
jgi:peptidoglycan/xylan/chitin deacetylase (PgdA/CDA1 family)